MSRLRFCWALRSVMWSFLCASGPCVQTLWPELGFRPKGWFRSKGWFRPMGNLLCVWLVVVGPFRALVSGSGLCEWCLGVVSGNGLLGYLVLRMAGLCE